MTKFTHENGRKDNHIRQLPLLVSCDKVQSPSFSSVFAFLSLPGCFARISPEEPLERFIPALTKKEELAGDIPMSDAPPRSPV